MSTEHHVKLCPRCRTEYTLLAARCADCDVDLVSPDEVPDEEEVEELPPASELACVRVAPLPWIRALSEGLQRVGVVHRIQPARSEDAPEGQRPDVFGNVQLFGLYVEDEHTARAQELDAGIAAKLLPEEAPALDEGDEEACPACGSALETGALECPDCGLAFG